MKSDGKTYKVMQTNDMLIAAAKRAAHDLHLKYIESGSELEINIADQDRKALHALCYDLDTFMQNNSMNIITFFSIFDDVAAELYRLMNHSFRRFAKKPAWTKAVYILSKQPLYQADPTKHC